MRVGKAREEIGWAVLDPSHSWNDKTVCADDARKVTKFICSRLSKVFGLFFPLASSFIVSFPTRPAFSVVRIGRRDFVSGVTRGAQKPISTALSRICLSFFHIPGSKAKGEKKDGSGGKERLARLARLARRLLFWEGGAVFFWLSSSSVRLLLLCTIPRPSLFSSTWYRWFTSCSSSSLISSSSSSDLSSPRRYVSCCSI